MGGWVDKWVGGSCLLSVGAKEELLLPEDTQMEIANTWNSASLEAWVGVCS